MAPESPTLEAVAAIIAKADVAWITRNENDKPDEKKARSMRDDPLRTYKEAGIDLCLD